MKWRRKQGRRFPISLSAGEPGPTNENPEIDAPEADGDAAHPKVTDVAADLEVEGIAGKSAVTAGDVIAD